MRAGTDTGQLLVVRQSRWTRFRAWKHEPHSRSSTRPGRTRPPFRRPRDSGRAGRRGACGARCRVGRRPRRSGRFCQDHDLPPGAQHDQSVPSDHHQSKRRAERPPRWSSPPEWLHQPGRVRLDLQLRAQQQVLGRHHPRRHQWRIRLQRHQHRRTQLDRGRPGDLLQRPMRWPVGARILRRRDRRRHPPTGDHRRPQRHAGQRGRRTARRTGRPLHGRFRRQLGGYDQRHHQLADGFDDHQRRDQRHTRARERGGCLGVRVGH